MTEPAPLLAVTHLSRRFAMRRGFLSRAAPSFLHAVDDVSLSIAPGRSVGLVGESGCGKSTLVRLVARLLDATEGEIAFDGEDLAAVPAARFARHPRRRELQVVFQDPTESLNPRYTAFDSIAEPLRLLEGVRDSAGLEARVKAAADKSVAAVIDVTKYGVFKVLGKGQLPSQPVVVKAKFFSKLAEKKIKVRHQQRMPLCQLHIYSLQVQMAVWTVRAPACLSAHHMALLCLQEVGGACVLTA